MAGSASITGRQHYVLGIGHPVTEAETEAPPAVYSIDPATGAVVGLVGPDGGTTYFSDFDEKYQLPAATTRITASQAVVGKSSKLVSVKCVSATAIALTIYDNGTTNAGTVLFSQTMSTGDEAIIPLPIQAINGLYASFTGTATFDIGAQDAV